MTAFAVDGRVRTLELESSPHIVVETPFQPVDGVVAQTTVLCETTVMGIVFTVAIDTSGWRVAEHPGLVTNVAVGVGMDTE